MAKLTDQDVETAFRLICAGHSVRAIAKKLRVTHPGLTRRLIKKYGQNYLTQCKPSATILLLQEYSQSSDRRLREAALSFAKAYAQEPVSEGDRRFLTLAEERNRSGRENYSGIDFSLLDTRRGKGVSKVC